MQNLKIKANLATPLCGAAPRFDAMLIHTIASNSGDHYKKCKNKTLARNTKLSEYESPEIPLGKIILNDIELYKCSQPIVGKVYSEYTENNTKKFPSSQLASIIKENLRKNIQTGSGDYKMRHVKLRIRLAKQIAWFVHGEKEEIKKILYNVFAIGKHKKYGYGIIGSWEYEEIDKDNSVFAYNGDQKVLMRIVPAGNHLKNVVGYSKQFGGVKPPYWHPENYMEIAYPI